MGAIGGLTLAGIGTAEAKRTGHNELVVSESTGRELSRVLRSRQFRDVTRGLPDRGARLDFRRAKTVRKQKEGDEYKLAVPLRGMDSFDPVTTVEGLHAHVDPATDERQIIVRYEYNEVGPAEVESSTAQNEASAATTDGVSTLAGGCQYSGITPGYWCQGVYDTEEACTVIGAAAVLIPANDVTGIGVIDDVLLPAVAAGAAGCAIEQAVEMGITDWLNACSTDNWVWEIYIARWWNPVPQKFLAIPRCG